MNPEHNTIEKTLLKVEAPQLKTNVSELQQIFIKFEILVDFKDKKKTENRKLAVIHEESRVWTISSNLLIVLDFPIFVIE